MENFYRQIIVHRLVGCELAEGGIYGNDIGLRAVAGFMNSAVVVPDMRLECVEIAPGCDMARPPSCGHVEVLAARGNDWKRIHCEIHVLHNS